MSDRYGTLDAGRPIPRYRHAREPHETAMQFLARVAVAAAFAYRVDPRQAESQPDFQLEVETIILPDGALTRSRARGRLHQTRDLEQIQSTGADQLFVYVMRSGRLDISPSRAGRSAGPGDIVIVDLNRPVELTITGYELNAMVIGRALLPPALRQRRLHGTVVPSNHALTGFVGTMVQQLFEQSDRLTAEQATSVLRHTAGLLGLMLEDVTHPVRGEISLKAAAEMMIDHRLEDAELTPALIAHGLGVSRTTLYRAFEKRGGIRDLIAARRLERAWTLLSSETGPSRDVVALACGYATAGKLDRALVDVFGLNSNAIRKADGAVRALLMKRASELLEDSWRRRIDTPQNGLPDNKYP